MPKIDKSQVKKVVLAYSGGLDTSIILKWLQTEYGAEVVTFTADLGQSEIEGGAELEEAKRKAENLGIEEIYIEDVREEFVRDFVFPMFRANAAYEGVYLLGTSIARPLISKRLVEIARETGADAIAHGATGKGNDQVRFELAAYALDPNIKVIAPWREWEFKSRTDLIAFAETHQIQVAKDKRGEAPFSVDANLLHSSSEGKVLEDPPIRLPNMSICAPFRRWMPPTSQLRLPSAFIWAMRFPSTANRCRPLHCCRASMLWARKTASDGSISWKTALSA